MLNIAGQKFGRLFVIRLADEQVKGSCKRWLCLCDCGNEKVIRSQPLRLGLTRSCGCLQRETSRAQGKKNATHGMKRTPEWRAWSSMKKRCENPKVPGYKDYGGRGITFHESWKSFEQFYADVGPRPSPSHSLDREDNNGNYEPGNVRWATGFEQGQNKRNNHIVTAFGRTGPLSSFFERGSMCHEYDLALQRILKSGWEAELAISLPPMDSRFH
jgi:hypothetical protein